MDWVTTKLEIAAGLQKISPYCSASLKCLAVIRIFNQQTFLKWCLNVFWIGNCCWWCENKAYTAVLVWNAEKTTVLLINRLFCYAQELPRLWPTSEVIELYSLQSCWNDLNWLDCFKICTFTIFRVVDVNFCAHKPLKRV